MGRLHFHLFAHPLISRLGRWHFYLIAHALVTRVGAIAFTTMCTFSNHSYERCGVGVAKNHPSNELPLAAADEPEGAGDGTVGMSATAIWDKHSFSISIAVHSIQSIIWELRSPIPTILQFNSYYYFCHSIAINYITMLAVRFY